MKRKKRTRIILISILLVVLIAGGVFLVVKKIRAPKPPDQVQDKNSNTYKQNETLFNSSNDPQNNNAQSNSGSNIPVNKPILYKSASTAPANVPVDFTCVGSEGLDCQVTLTNSANGQVINLDKKKITKDRMGQTTAYWVWQTVAGKWQIIATVSNGSSQASSDAQTMEVK